MTDDAIAAVKAAKYVLLTTFKRDGSAVSTPVWAAPGGDSELLIWTARNTGKVKRIRNSSRVTVAPCTTRGKPTGAAVEATATLLDDAGTVRVRTAIGRRYGWLGTLLVNRGRLDEHIGIQVELLAPGSA